MDLLLGVGLVLGVMILVHEWGHFIVARLFGVRVDVFSIGFGPRLFGWKRGATDYRVSLLPLGGYVRMAGQDPTDIDSKDRGLASASETRPTGAPDELMSKPRWQRALISFAGPAVNLIFPVILLVGFYTIKGEPYPAYLDQPLQVVSVPAKAPSGPGNFRPGDKIVAIDGIQNPIWQQAEEFLSKAEPGSSVPLEVENNGERRKVILTLPVKDSEQAAPVFGYPPLPPIIEDVVSGSPADRAGLKPGDKVIAVNGHPIQWWGEFVDQVRNSNGGAIALEVTRKNGTAKVTVTPEKTVLPRGETAYLIGVGPKEEYRYKRIPITQSVKYATSKTYESTVDTIGVIGKLFSGQASVKQLQGVVGITRLSGQAIHKGPLAVISLMVLISVNLGILNLLPIPILDGGHILLLTIEGLLRRDLSMAFKERFVQVGLVFLLVLFVIVMYNDVVRLLPIHS
jgi:regulator of sigma E protease